MKKSTFNIGKITKLGVICELVMVKAISLDRAIYQAKRISDLPDGKYILLRGFCSSFFAAFGIGFFFSSSLIDLSVGLIVCFSSFIFIIKFLIFFFIILSLIIIFYYIYLPFVLFILFII